jgi:excisionase family DNA binding protein
MSEKKIDSNPEIWTVLDVMKFLKLSKPTVYRMARNGDIPCTIIGKSTFRFSRKKIESFV